MSTALLQTTGGTSVFTRAYDSPNASADQASTFSSAAEDIPSHTWDELIDQLISVAILPDDWDGEGSIAPHRALVAGATKLALALQAAKYPPAERVVASVNGTVYFEWHTPFGYEEIEVTSPLDAEFRRVQEGAGVMTEIVSISLRS